MAEPISFRKGFENCRPRIGRYWRHLVFVVTPLSFLAGIVAPAAAEGPVKPASVLIGGVVLGFVAGLAATAERFRAVAAGGPFLSFGLLSGAMFALVGPTALFFASVLLSLLATAAGLLTGLVSQQAGEGEPGEGEPPAVRDEGRRDGPTGDSGTG
jgi:peptidoglycan/LPS O-acetylase OafA/YrhL